MSVTTISTYVANPGSTSFTRQQKFVATLAMRLGKPVNLAKLLGFSNATASQLIASGNTKLAQAQSAARAQGASYNRPPSASQLAAIQAFCLAFGCSVPVAKTGMQADELLIEAIKQSSLTQAYDAYVAWLGMANANAS